MFLIQGICAFLVRCTNNIQSAHDMRTMHIIILVQQQQQQRLYFECVDNLLPLFPHPPFDPSPQFRLHLLVEHETDCWESAITSNPQPGILDRISGA